MTLKKATLGQIQTEAIKIFQKAIDELLEDGYCFINLTPNDDNNTNRAYVFVNAHQAYINIPLGPCTCIKQSFINND